MLPTPPLAYQYMVGHTDEMGRLTSYFKEDPLLQIVFPLNSSPEI